jgi:hypothetical protein
MKLQNRTVLVTGASSGIGRAIACRCAEDGATVILSARREEKLLEVKDQVERIGGKGIVITCDVTDPEDVKNLFLKSTENGRVIDVVFNNAGLGHIAEIHETTVEQIDQMIDVNLKGAIYVTKFATEVMVRQEYGHIFMTSSLAGLITLPEWSVYVASKWGVTGFADSIRQELKKYGVKITTIHPGAVKTEFFDEERADIDIASLGDAIEPLDVADAAYSAVFTGKKKVIVPGMAKSTSFLYKFLPGVVAKQIEKATREVEYHDEPIKEDAPEFSYIKPVEREES